MEERPSRHLVPQRDRRVRGRTRLTPSSSLTNRTAPPANLGPAAAVYHLGHSHLSTTGTYLEGINTEEIISTVHARRAPMMRASAGLAL
jgi:hypothetical protein